MTYATWNPTDKAASVTLSGGNLVMATASGDPISGCRATTGKSSGKWFWEVTITALSNVDGYAFVGVETSSADINSYPGVDSDGWGWYAQGQQRVHAAGFFLYGAPAVVGDVLGFALDMGAGELTCYLNGVSQGLAFSGIAGTIYPAAGTTDSTLTANFGASAFAYSVPSGFTAGFTDSAGFDGYNPILPLFDGFSDSAAPATFSGFNPLMPLFDGFSDSNFIPPVTDSIPIATFNGGIRMLTMAQRKKRRHHSDYILLLLS